MFIEKLEFKNLRNLEDGELLLNENINILYGDNAQGKTNLLEAIYFAAIGRSHRTNNYKELIKFGETETLISLVTFNADTRIKIHLTKNLKEIYVDSFKIKKLGELFGNLLVVIFSPEDLDLVKHGPNLRRKFIDLTLCQLSKVYYYDLGLYYKTLNQRNNLLKKKDKDISTIFLWDEQLATYGEKIMNYRQNYIKEINEFASIIHSDITNGKETLEILYKPNVNINLQGGLKEKLEKNLERDILLKTTTSGIHRDDILVTINGLEAKTYGSQGQQRTASLAMKLSTVLHIHKEKELYPIVLLDDVFSELDKNRQEFLLKSLKGQVIITCTGVEDFLKDLNYDMKKIKEGKIYEQRS
ncbi:MAG: DNA replication/repair protein RecF [Defluviitaleaceae bacterium]|nr:DNA replication/repair protein RecF [Defluviitaleaceae bacterium]